VKWKLDWDSAELSWSVENSGQSTYMWGEMVIEMYDRDQRAIDTREISLGKLQPGSYEKRSYPISRKELHLIHSVELREFRLLPDPTEPQ
jgi:hypothetical protein